jgi:hypothetical protein
MEVPKPKLLLNFWPRLNNWSDSDIVIIVKSKLTREAFQFLNGRDNWIQENVMYEILRAALIERFSDKLPAR